MSRASGGSGDGGSSGEVQYNNAGAFAGAADVEIEGRAVASACDFHTCIQAAPVAGGVKLYGLSFNGQDRLGFLGPDGKVRLFPTTSAEFSVQGSSLRRA